MATPLLATKLHRPPTRRLLDRARLVRMLEEGVATHRLVTVTAPAGYGKTSALAQWADSSEHMVSWLTLEAGDDDPHRLVRYLVTSWSEQEPRVRDTELFLLANSLGPELEAVLAAFVNVAAELSDHIAFVFDDAHLIAEATVLDAMRFLIDHAPANLHFVLAGRSTPALPLMRYRSRDDVLEISASDLSFTPDETAAFFHDLMGLEVEQDVVAELHDRLEGWPAGVQLAAIALKTGTPQYPPVSLSGRHRFIAGYLKEEVLAPLGNGLRRFLLQTSLLDQMCGSLCDAVTGEFGGQATLETLERENLFVVSLDDESEWYRYHHLFADVLQEEARRAVPEEIPGLHRRAARWYLEREMPEEALGHAVAADDDVLGTTILDRNINALIGTGQITTLRRWLLSLPTVWRTRQPFIGLADSALLLASGEFEASIARIDEVEQRLSALPLVQAQPQLARVSAVRCYISCFQNDLPQAESYAEEALQGLQLDDVAYRADIFGALGDTYRRHGMWEQARSSYLQVLNTYDGDVAPYRAPHVFGALADLDLLRGRLRAADANWNRALEALQDPGARGTVPLPVAGWVYLRLGEVAYEWNDLAAARDYLACGTERALLGGDTRSLIAKAVLEADIHLAEGRADAGDTALQPAHRLLAEAAFPMWRARVARCQVNIWIAQDRLRTLVGWAEEYQREYGNDLPLDERLVDLAVARVLLLRGDDASLARATEMIADVLRLAEAEGQVAMEIDALAMRAMVMERRGQTVAAMTALEHALRLAEPEGYVRLFVDLGRPMGQLLQEARDRQIMAPYVEKLLQAFGEAPAMSVQGLPEPLSPRELDVIRLVAAGLTNEEVASELFISPETVKKHTGHIYGKLGVTNRTEAAARARDLGLLPDH